MITNMHHVAYSKPTKEMSSVPVLCNNGFSQKSGLNSSIFSGTGDKPFVCKKCNKGFSFRHNLKRHYLTHTGEKPFLCEKCGKAFSRKSHLTRHLLTHNYVKSFVCEKCSKEFSNRHLFDKHLLLHNVSEIDIERFPQTSNLSDIHILYWCDDEFTVSEDLDFPKSAN